MLSSGLVLTIIVVSSVFVLATLFFLGTLVREIIKGKRKFVWNGFKSVATFLFSLLFVYFIGYCLFNAPRILYDGTSWAMISEYGPSALIYSVICLTVIIALFYVYYILSTLFIKENDTPFFMIIVLSIASALGNSLIIFIINATLNRSLNYETRRIGIESGLYLFFLLGIALFTICAMIVRKKLISVTSNYIYEKRSEIINKVLNAQYEKFEALEDGKVQAVLNNDTEAVSGIVNMLVTGLTGIITLVTCFIYLGTLNFLGMCLSVAIIGLAVVMFTVVSRSAEKYFEKNRDIQNAFFNYINNLIGGFKELQINKRKNKEFKTDIMEKCKEYRDTRIDAEYKFVGASVFGEILYVAVIGVVVFTFPYIFETIRDTTLRNYVMIYLYMGGIVNQEIFMIPGLVRILVSFRRIKEFINDLSTIEAPEQQISEVSKDKTVEIKLQGVKYHYKNTNGEQFSVGPLNFSVKSGEIVFISGGNGSGKSTLAKLVVGLYPPDEGVITVNGREVDSQELGVHFTSIFSDFHLFNKLYGIDYDQKTEEIKKYLDILHISDKVEINDGEFSTVKLSTGQRKRLALLVSYLEDKDVYLFDEWAADQDPEYRRFFYKVLLPELRARGKAVVAITHDDRYFGDADRLIKMELGQIVETKVNNMDNANTEAV